MRLPIALLAALAAVPAAAQAPAAPPAATADAARIRNVVAGMAAEMRDGRTFLYRPLVQDGKTVAALEYWKAPGRPAVHPDEGEYAVVIEGAGTLVSGGRMVAPQQTRPGLVEGSRIEGGTTRTLGPGDVLLVPAGVPHWFGITGGKLVLLGMKLPVAR